MDFSFAQKINGYEQRMIKVNPPAQHCTKQSEGGSSKPSLSLRQKQGGPSYDITV